MKCPFSDNREIGESCNRPDCWMHHKNAQNHCAAIDTGSTHLVTEDVARIYNETVVEAKIRIDTGREKMKSWLLLLDSLDDVEDGGDDLTSQETAQAKTLAHKLPIEQFARMGPRKWRFALNFAKRSTLTETRVLTKTEQNIFHQALRQSAKIVYKARH